MVGWRKDGSVSQTNKARTTRDGVADRGHQGLDPEWSEVMKRVDWRAIRSHQNYTRKEVCTCLGVVDRTVGRWVVAGLPTIGNQRPQLIAGRELRTFLQRRRGERKRRCPPGHLFCVRCKRPTVPFGHFVDWLPASSGHGLLRGLCGTCGSLMHRGASFSCTRFGGDIAESAATLKRVQLPYRERRLRGG